MKTEKSFYPDGQLKYEFGYQEVVGAFGIYKAFHGQYKYWYQSTSPGIHGQLLCKLNYLNGKEHGIHERWYSDRIHSKQSKFNFVNGRQTGPQYYWYKNFSSDADHGQQAYIRNYVIVNNVSQLHGLLEEWYFDGQQERKENYVNNVQHSIQINNNKITYYKYGKEITKEEYDQYLNSIEKGIMNILSIGKNTLDLIVQCYLINLK